MPETGLTNNQIIQELARSTHGDLGKYTAVGAPAALTKGEFYSHLTAWNQTNGQIRDSKVALPVIYLSVGKEPEFRENALAHLALQDPRTLVRGLDFAVKMRNEKGFSYSRCDIRKLVNGYLRVREARWSWWEKTTVQHRESMKTLYARFHIKPNAMADLILFKNQPPIGTVFSDIAKLKDLSPHDAAATIIKREIPFLVAISALGGKAKDTDMVLALIERMSPTELVTNTKMLEKLGVKTNPALRGAFEQALVKAASSKKATYKTTAAAAAVEDATLKAKLSGLQEKQIAKLGGVDGDWLVLADKSGSMGKAVEVAKLVSATLARSVKGSVHLVFFDTSPRYENVTGMTYEEIQAVAKHITAEGGTSIGCGLGLIISRNLSIDGIVIVSDGEENSSPQFAERYMRYREQFDHEPTIYFYQTSGHPQNALSMSLNHLGLEHERFDLRDRDVDYHSLPNLVQTMRTQKYSLVDAIMATPLLKLDEPFKAKIA